VKTDYAWILTIKDEVRLLSRFEIGSVAPAVGRFATFANAFARPAAVKCVLAFKAVARFCFVNALWFWFHCWFSHSHTVAYGGQIVKNLLTVITILLHPIRYTAHHANAVQLKILTVLKQLVAWLSLVITLIMPLSVKADMAKGLAAARQGNYEAALKEWLPLAEDGNASAQFNVGQLYRLGRGVPRNFTLAGQWYEKAAYQWHSAARHNLAVLYEKGLGVPVNYEKAFEWYEKAASLDYGIAQFNLAVMYSLGQGTKRDLVNAYAWYAIAADRDVDGAEENLQQIAQQMSKAQLEEANKRAREWIDWRKTEPDRDQ
jgi:hypothetical protein